MSEPLYITFMWHMHQPYYKDPATGEYALPWTYLHAVKDYYDMAAIVDETAGARAVFNLVPSLLDQIEEYAAGTAADPFLLRGQMAPSDMVEEDRLFVLENFFSANRQRMIEPYQRYLQLLYLAGDGDSSRTAERLRHFRDQDLLDLQVWFFLAWTGEAARRHHPGIQELILKGKNYTPGDKAYLFDTQREILRGIIPLYRKLHAEGKAELAVSPYFHPILPLLCDIKSAQTAMPRANLPANRFRHPEDARSQVELGIIRFTETFGFPPAGMWPSEGSVSDEALGIIADCGLKWTASDEEILARTLPGGLGPGREALYNSHSFLSGEKDLRLFFRDHALSDLIGFTYSQWDPDRAVHDLVSRLRDIRLHAPNSRNVAVILDGENAWEYYPGNGYEFLCELYAKVAATPGLEPATFSEVMAKVPAQKTLGHIHPGSWINANFGVWVGHPEENLGWDHIARAREAAVLGSPRAAALLSHRGDTTGDSDQAATQICRSLYTAEGSDWFWWYGDDHFSPHSDRFDALFRKQLMHVYRLLGQDIPRELFEPIKKKSVAGFVREPTAFISPAISGLVTDYFEWLDAGLYDLTKQASAMHSAESLLQSFFYGFDRKALFFRIDGNKSLDRSFTAADRLSLHLILDREYRVVMGLSSEECPLEVKQDGVWQPLDVTCRCKILRICEVRVPLDAVNPEPGGKIFAYMTLTRNNEEIGRWPIDAPMLLKYAGPQIEVENWLI
ncbi:MAG TPA: glycoside hydrolase family 57 protein [Geobacteraceae bacterium]|nr:glycoside hydrolase family 57 protein [Geobacteraceae bacterium]